MKHLALFFLFLAGLFYLSTSMNLCERTGRWRLSNKTFPKDFQAQVKLVAFFKASCKFCQTQSVRLGELYREMIQTGYNISFIIVNPSAPDCIGKADVFAQSQLPVLQDISKLNVWTRYSADTDDMLIFDECDRLVNHLKLPDSLVHTGSVKNALLTAYNNKTCGDTCLKPTKKAENTFRL